MRLGSLGSMGPVYKGSEGMAEKPNRSPVGIDGLRFIDFRG